MEKKFENKKYKSLEITEDEKKGIESYASSSYKFYNNLLSTNLTDENEKKEALHNVLAKDDVLDNLPDQLDMVLKYTPLIYSAMCKYRIEHGNADNKNMYRGTSEEEVKKQIEKRHN